MSPMSQARNRVPRFAEAAVVRARLTVVPRRVPKAPKVPFVTMVSLLLIGGVVGLLLFNTSMQQSSFTATSLEARAAVLDAREQSLQMELDTLRDPQKVAAGAKGLGMVPRTGPSFIRLSDGAVLGSPTVAESSDGMRIAPLPTPKPKSLRPDPIIVTVDPKQKQPAVIAGDPAAISGDPAVISGDTDASSAIQGSETGRNDQQERDRRQGRAR